MEEKQMEFGFMEEIKKIIELKKAGLRAYEDGAMDEISDEAKVEFGRMCDKYKMTPEDSKQVYILAQQF